MVSNLLLCILLKLGPARSCSPQQSHGTIPLGSLWPLGFCPCYFSACSLTHDPCPSGFHLANTSYRKHSEIPPTAVGGHFCAFIAAYTHSTVVFLTLDLMARPSAPHAPPQPKLLESRIMSVLSVGACASKVPSTEQMLIHSRTSYESLLCARHHLLAGWKD